MTTHLFAEKVVKTVSGITVKNNTSRSYGFVAEVYLWNPATSTKAATATLASVVCAGGATVTLPSTAITMPNGGDSDITLNLYVQITATPSAGGTPVTLTPFVDSGNPVVITVIPSVTITPPTWS